MYSLILVPRNNEDLLIKKAKLLGYDRVYFVYSRDEEKNFDDLPEKFGVIIKKISLCNSKTCFSLKQRGLTLMKTTSDQNVFERIKPNIVFGLEEVTRRDSIHQRISGLNHVMCGLAKKNHISILFDVHALINADDLPILIGRIRQNIQLCRKYSVNILLSCLVSDPQFIVSPLDLIGVGKNLGFSPSEAKKSVSFTL